MIKRFWDLFEKNRSIGKTLFPLQWFSEKTIWVVNNWKQILGLTVSGLLVTLNLNAQCLSDVVNSAWPTWKALLWSSIQYISSNNPTIDWQKFSVVKNWNTYTITADQLWLWWIDYTETANNCTPWWGAWFPIEVVSSLPVELTHFIAKCIDNGQEVRLDRETASEQNNKGFWIQRLVDGKWRNIHFVEGAGNTGKMYTFIDDLEKDFDGNPISNTWEKIYKLTQVDFDWNTTDSPLQKVEDCDDGNGYDVKAFPNPVQDILHIQTGAKDQSYTAQIYNTQGQLVLSESITAGTGTIDVSALGHGMYLIHIININHQIIHIQKLVR